MARYYLSILIYLVTPRCRCALRCSAAAACALPLRTVALLFTAVAAFLPYSCACLPPSPALARHRYAVLYCLRRGARMAPPFCKHIPRRRAP